MLARILKPNAAEESTPSAEEKPKEEAVKPPPIDKGESKPSAPAVQFDSDSRDAAAPGSISSESQPYDSASNCSSSVTPLPPTSQPATSEPSSSYNVNYPQSPQVFMDLDSRCQCVESFDATPPVSAAEEKQQITSFDAPASPKVLLDLDSQAKGSGMSNGMMMRPSSPKQFLDLDAQNRAKKRARVGKAGVGRMPDQMMQQAMFMQQQQQGMGPGRQGGQHPVMMMQGMMDRFGGEGPPMMAGPGGMHPQGQYPNPGAYGHGMPQQYPHPMQQVSPYQCLM
jgi:hypothetical protein